MNLPLIACALVLLCATTAAAQTLELTPREFSAGEIIYQGGVGRLSVPQRHEQPDAHELRLELAVVVLRSTASEPGPPTFFLNGIPAAATNLAGEEYWASYLELGDVVLLDQRGAGRSQPALIWEHADYHAERLFADYATAEAHAVATATAIASYCGERGVELAAFNTRESARDVDAVRTALGYEKIRLVGHSGGSHLGFEYLRQFGPRVERFVSLGTAGPNDIHSLPSELDEALRRISTLAAADTRIGQAMPDLFARVRSAVARLDEQPLALTVQHPDSGEACELLLGGHGLQFLLVQDLGDPPEIALFPRLIHELEQGRTELAGWFVQQRYQQLCSFPALLFVNRGASGATAERWKTIRSEAAGSPFGMVRCLFSPTLDAAFGIADLGDAFRAPVRSKVPTLFVSGSLDGKTPPARAASARLGFPTSTHLILENGGHNDLADHPEVHARIVRFLAGENLADETVVLPPVRFALLEGKDPLVKHPALGDSDL